MDQSKRYANLSLREADLIAGSRHVLCAYIMKPARGGNYLAAAAHFAAESSTGTNVEVGTTDDFTRSLDALHGKHTVDKSTRRELFEAMKQVALQDCGPREQFPSIGCSIKWREEK